LHFFRVLTTATTSIMCTKLWIRSGQFNMVPEFSKKGVGTQAWKKNEKIYNNHINTVYYTYIVSYTVYPTVSVYLTFGEYTYTKRLEPYYLAIPFPYSAPEVPGRIRSWELESGVNLLNPNQNTHKFPLWSGQVGLGLVLAEQRVLYSFLTFSIYVFLAHNTFYVSLYLYCRLRL
jgi:hypothetical protein